MSGPAGNGALSLRVRDLRVRIGEVQILHGVDLDLAGGELVAVVGPNGAGKSTLVRAVAGLQRFGDGQVLWRGSDVRQIGGRRLAGIRAFVPQRAQAPSGVTVRDAVRIGRSSRLKPLQRLTPADQTAIDHAMERAGIGQLTDRQLSTLSGGELQRSQIAVALAQDAPALIADEPTSHLDLGSTVAAARLLRRLADDGLAVLVVAHDLALAAAIADTVVVISNGRSIGSGPPQEVLDRRRLSEVWEVDASLETLRDGRTALHVGWLPGTGGTSSREMP